MKIGVLRGGIDKNYETSLQEGGDLISYIFENLFPKWQPVDILIDRDGIWHLGGIPIQPSELMHKVDVVWNLSHPSFSNILESFSIRNIGAPNFSSLAGNSREMLRLHMQSLGVKMPKYIVLPLYQEDFDGSLDEYAQKKAKEVFEKFSSPWIVKSLTEDVSMGVHVAKTFPELVKAIKDVVSHGKSILIEELITGKNAEVHSVAQFRGEDVYTMPVYGLSSMEKEKVHYLAKDLYRHLGAKHYLNSHFVLHPRGGIYLTNLKFVPNLRKESNFHQSCDLIGLKSHNIILHLLEQAV